MENATHALFMAAGVLIAVLILSLAIFLFSSASSVSEEYDSKMSESERLKFNSQFTKYVTSYTLASDPKLQNASYNVIADVVSVLNLAYNLNESYDYDASRGIQVCIKGINTSLTATYSDSDKIGITPLVQAHYKRKDKNMFYKLYDKSKYDYNSFSYYTNGVLLHTNKLLEKFSDCVYYKTSNEKLYKIYKYYFACSVNYNKDTGLVDEVLFTCTKNEDNYNDVYDQQTKAIDI